MQVIQLTYGSTEFNEIIRVVSEQATKIGFEIGQKMSKPDRVGGYELAAEVTGYAIDYLRNLKSNGEIPFTQQKGRHPVFRESDLIKWKEGKS